MISNFISQLPNPIAIVGMAITGEAVFNLLVNIGYDKKNIFRYDDKKQDQSDFKNYQDLITIGKPKTLCVSPGVPLTTPWIQKALSEGCVLTSELEIAQSLLTTEKIVAITGSIGKSTTTALIGHALQTYLPDTFMGGNLGTPLAQYVLEARQQKRQLAPWIALELSSYQLENYKNLKAEVGIFTYLTANHLERYPDKNSYYQAKWNMHSHISKKIILNSNGGDLKEWSTHHSDKIKIDMIWTDRHLDLIKKYNLSECELIGSHNQDNIALAAAFLKYINAPEVAFQTLKKFKGLSHRVENLGFIGNIRYINDSKATTIESVITATLSSLETVPHDKHLWLLIGGRDKNLPWQDLQILKNNSQIKFVFFGECSSIAKEKSQLPGPSFETLKVMLAQIKCSFQDGDSVLLSPGGTSLDEFKNFEDRGNFFKQQVY